jgi:hypothetical protein
VEDPPEYDERLTVPVWWWLPGAVAAAVLAIEVHLAAPSVPLPAVVLPVAALLVGLLLALGRTRVTVRSGELRVAGARLPLRLVSEVAPLDAAGRRVLLGPTGDPAAFVVQRAWARGAVYLRVDDPAGVTPYWLVSTRRPAELASVLQAARLGSA